MTQIEIWTKFNKSCYEKLSFRSFGNLLKRAKESIIQDCDRTCSVCLESELMIIENKGVIFTPTCKHNICANCLVKNCFRPDSTVF